jgi:prepilin-type N-terminal cleavage/methylation domain-containing protein
MRKVGSPSGFTLVELLVVIAIIGILVALLLPAIQAAREAGRRISCGNNIKQLTLSLHTYHDIHNSMPINYGNNDYGTTSTSKSWIVGALPFMEQKPLYENVVFMSVSAGDNAIGNPENGATPPNTANGKVAATVIKGLLCPSDGDNGRGKLTFRRNAGEGVRAVTCYKACAGANWAWGDANALQTNEDRRPAPWPGDANGLDRGNGIICRNGDTQNQNYHDFSFVTDGTANTFAIGEAVPRWCTHSWWWWFNGSTATCGVPLNYKPASVLTGSQSLEGNWDDWVNNYSFMSRHPTGGQFGMCDGAVKFVPDSIDFTTYKRLATCAGGVPAQVPN